MNLKLVVRFLNKISTREVFAFVIILLVSVSYIPIPFFLKNILEELQANEIRMDFLIQQCIILMSIFTFQAIGVLFSRKILVKYIRTSIETNRKFVLSNYLNSHQIPEGETTSSIHKKIFTDTEIIDRFYNSLLTNILPSLIIASISLVLMFYISPILMVVVFILSSITLFVINYFKKKRDSALSDYYSSYEQFNKLILFILRFRQLILSQSMITDEQIRIGKNLSSLRDKGIKMEMGFTKAINVQEFGQSVTLVVILIVAAWMKVSGKIQLEIILVFFFLVYLLKKQFHVLSNHIQNIEDGVFALKKIAELSSKIGTSFRPKPGLQKVHFDGSLSFQNLAFSYPNRSTLLENVSFSLLPGQINLLQGKNGIGKSTIMRLMLGYLHPTSGSISIEGIDTKELDYNHFRSQTGVIFQHNELFDGTLKDNLLYGVTAAQTEIEAGLEKTGLKDWVEGLPLLLETPMNELEEKISGGQKQRIVLTRALLRKPKLLILDEPTNHLDTDFNNTLKSLLVQLKGEMTILLISPNSDLESIADQMIILDEKQIRVQ